MERIEIISKVDKTFQPAMIQPAQGGGERPLLVALHTWSYSCDQYYDGYAELCRKRNWHLIFPEFRGPNMRPEACGSDLVVSDIEDAVEYMKKTVAVDNEKIYLVGGSGGGHCSLLMAGRRPDLWSAVSSWSPITDVEAWYHQSLNTQFDRYAKHIELVCGGTPAEKSDFAENCRKRSPLTYLDNAKNLTIDISSGIHDGHIGSVQVSHAINAFNILAANEDKIYHEDIDYIVKNEKIPPHLQSPVIQDPAFNGKEIYFRRQSKNVRLTLFEGGHELLPSPAMQFLAKQSRSGKNDWSNGISAATPTQTTELSH